jgi:hypothetical protein
MPSERVLVFNCMKVRGTALGTLSWATLNITRASAQEREPKRLLQPLISGLSSRGVLFCVLARHGGFVDDCAP